MKTEIIHPSKIGLEILAPIVIILGFATTIMIINMVWIGLMVCGILILFITHIYLSTYYKITDDHQLFIKCGVVESFDIHIDDIEWIKKSNEWSNAPALSLDRLEIGYKGGRILISPKDKKKFVEDLKKINPKIWWANETYKRIASIRYEQRRCKYKQH
jgi:hypothetical protein